MNRKLTKAKRDALQIQSTFPEENGSGLLLAWEGAEGTDYICVLVSESKGFDYAIRGKASMGLCREDALALADWIKEHYRVGG